MRHGVIACLAGAAVLAAGLGIGPKAAAGGFGYGYHPGYYGYYAPPVYAYSYVPYAPAYGAYAPVYCVSCYTARVNIFRGPRWNYAAAYYNPRSYRRCGRRGGVCGARAYVSGPIVRAWRRW